MFTDYCYPGFSYLGCEAGIIRQMSSDSMSSINSLSSACSAASQQSAATDGDIGKKKNKKKGWVSNIERSDGWAQKLLSELKYHDFYSSFCN